MLRIRVLSLSGFCTYDKGLNVEDISCVIIPDRCVGLPTLAAIEQEIPVIAVKENKNRMQNNLEKYPFKQGKLFIVDNYLEAVGVMNAIKSGISLDAVRRPNANTMDAILVSSNNKGDTDLLLKLLKKMGLKSKLLSETEKEDYGLLAAMMEADRSDVEDESVIISKLKEKCS